MFPWNRKEILTTYNPAIRGAVCDELLANGIQYESSTSSNGPSILVNASRRANYGSYGLDCTNDCYHVFVHKKDYDEATHIVRKARR